MTRLTQYEQLKMRLATELHTRLITGVAVVINIDLNLVSVIFSTEKLSNIGGTP